MATKTFTVTKQYFADTITGDANPGDSHIVIGKWAANSYVTRALLYAPVSFTGMTSINSARIYMRGDAPGSGFHVQGASTATISVRRKTADWSETSGGVSSTIDELWGGDGDAYVETGYTASNDGFANIPDIVNDTWYSIDITDVINAWFSGSPNYGIMIYNDTSEASSAFGKQFSSRHVSGSQPYIWIDYETNTAPNAPTSLSPTGDAIVSTGTSVTVSGTRSDPDSGDYITGVNIIVYSDDGATVNDEETYYPTGSPTTFSRTMTVGGGNRFFKWKARTRDKNNVWGPFSALQRFKANSAPNAPATATITTPTTAIKTLTPTVSITSSDADATDTMNAYQWIVETSAGAAVYDSGTVATAAGATAVQPTYAGPALSWQTSYRWRARTRDTNNVWGPYSSNITFTTYTAGTPISLDPSGNEVTGNLTPTLTFSRANTDYTIASYAIELYESNGTTLKWSSGTLTSGITSGASVTKVYNGAALSYGTQYKWRARVTGNIGGTSAYSALQSFTTLAANAATQTAPLGAPITTLTPTFTGGWNENLNAYQIILYAADGVTQIWDSTLLTQTAALTYSKVYNGTALAWNTTYKWKIRVRRAADNVVQNYTGLATFTTDTAGQPTLTAPISNSWQTTLTPTFTGTTSGGETITTFRIRLYEADGVTLTWDSGDLAGSGTSFSKVYNGANALIGGRSYKWQARYIKSTGPTGNYSALEDFHVNATPNSPSGILPVNGAIVGTLTPTFTATYEDADLGPWGDFPTQMEIEVRNNATDTLIATQTRTTTLIAGTNDITWDGTPALAYETTYKWRVRYRDSKSVDGAWSSYNTFKPSQPSTVDLTSPTTTIASPQVTVTWSFSSPSGKVQKSYRVQITRTDDLIQVYDSGVVLSTANSHIVPAGYLTNGTGYTFAITTVDSDGI